MFYPGGVGQTASVGGFGGDNFRTIEVTCALPAHSHGSGSLTVDGGSNGFDLASVLVTPQFTPLVPGVTQFTFNYDTDIRKDVSGVTSSAGVSDPTVTSSEFSVIPKTYFTNYYLCVGYAW